MSTTRFMILVALALAPLGGCDALEPKEVRQSKHTLSGVYNGTLDANSTLVVSSNRVFATKTVPKDEAAAQADVGRSVFGFGLYPKLRQYCGACHGTNAVPFASPGLDLAYATAKRFIAIPAAESQIIKNVLAGHNGSDPAWAVELSPLVEAVATAVKESGP